MKKAVCIHGHFYQPPRENPWLEAVEVQDSAHPFHDWNEKITVECYAPNGAARLVDGGGRIVEIVNNFSRISFNFGPTLLAWIERHSPVEYSRIIEGDRESRRHNGGHGNAIAQPYNHMIMPLAGERDRITQIVWGLREFERHFGRPAEGMWLPEAAVDLLTLDLLEQHGIRFTILSPYQAKRIRPLGKTKWEDVSGGRIDTTRPYQCRLPGGRAIALFFYDANIAHEIAFGQLLGNGEGFARRLKAAFDPNLTDPQLVHVATDGESYGHHKTHGDMALAYALAVIERDKEITLTNYGRFLEEHPPQHEVEIYENSSWSCAHGLERWRSDCGCKLDPSRLTQQRWRTALRESLDWLRGQIDPLFEQRAAELVRDPWAARNQYVTAFADHRSDRIDPFCAAHQRSTLTPASVVELLRLLEMQRHGMLMYTSCGWFFDDISGLEAVQNLKYACRAIQLAGALGLALEGPFLERLAKAESNDVEFGDGAEIYRRFVRPAVADLRRVAAHAAMEAALHGELEEGDQFCYRIIPRDFRHVGSGGASLTVGRMETQSSVTRETEDTTFAVLALRGHDVQCSVRPTAELADSSSFKKALIETYSTASLADVVRTIDGHFGLHHFTLKDLFLESRRHILADIIRDSLERYQGTFRDLFEGNQRLMEFVKEADVRLPKSFLVAAEDVLNDQLDQAVQVFLEQGDSALLGETLRQARRWEVSLRLAEMEPRLRNYLTTLIAALADTPSEGPARRAAAFVHEVKSLNLPLYFWQAQNEFREAIARHGRALADNAGAEAKATLAALRELGRQLGFVEGDGK